MQVLIRALATLALLIGGQIAGSSISAYAQGSAPGCPSGETPSQVPGGWICIPVSSPGTPGGEAHQAATGVAGGPNKCYDGKREVPCNDEYGGVWLPDASGPATPQGKAGCYGFRLVPQPGASSPLWRGHDPSEGSVWSCDPTISVLENTWFVPTGEDPLVDPAVLAQEALGRMKLEQANAQIAPGPDFHTYVHIDNWLWLPEAQWHNLQETVSAGPTSVTVTAEPIRVDWNMGTETTSCYNAGRVWQKGMTDAAKTSCSFVYDSIEDPTGDTHSVSAQMVYGVAWVCSGACLTPSGDLGEIAAPAGAATTIEVRQRQTVVTQ